MVNDKCPGCGEKGKFVKRVKDQVHFRCPKCKCYFVKQDRDS